MEFELRDAQPGDAPEVVRLMTQLGYSASIAETRERLEQLRDERYCTQVAAAGSELLGWISGERRLTLESGTIWEIVGLVVDARARRHRVGAALVGAIERWARDQGASAVRVRSNVARVESHDFYLALGYERVKTQHAYMRTL